MVAQPELTEEELYALVTAGLTVARSLAETPRGSTLLLRTMRRNLESALTKITTFSDGSDKQLLKQGQA